VPVFFVNYQLPRQKIQNTILNLNKSLLFEAPNNYQYEKHKLNLRFS
jgi:hypothetical protein